MANSTGHRSSDAAFLHTRLGIQQITPLLANLISHTLIRPVGKIKTENFHVFDIHWLYRKLLYAIVKVDVTERNDVTKLHGVNTIWRTSAIEGNNYMIKNPLSGMQEKESIMAVRDR